MITTTKDYPSNHSATDEVDRMMAELAAKVEANEKAISEEIKAKAVANFSNDLSSKIDSSRTQLEEYDGIESTDDTLIEAYVKAQAPEPEKTKPSPVEGMSFDELVAYSKQSSTVFGRNAKPVDREKQAKAEPTWEEIYNKPIPLDPRKIGVDALQADFDKSLADPSRGIRDFYNHAYDDQGSKIIRQKEHYLNLPLTGSLSELRANEKAKIESYDKFNSTGLATINDGAHHSMTRLHKEELDANPNDEKLKAKHALEANLFAYREGVAMHSVNSVDPVDAAQLNRESFKEIIKSQVAYKEHEWGRKMDPTKVPEIETQFKRFNESPAPMVAKQSLQHALSNKIAKLRMM